uniref:WAP four-disulfide core domain 8 n=1 Tax=Urocitellus parryii TaxID=9999 RepID=A0A8D2KCV7_UROPR
MHSAVIYDKLDEIILFLKGGKIRVSRPYFLEILISCPRERLFCDVMRPDLCKSDFNCPDYMKCCTFACGKKCMDPYEEPCMLPFKEGDCKMRLQRWYYDFKKQQCRTFIYHGCQGNANSFLRLDDCKKAWEKKSTLIDLATR